MNFTQFVIGMILIGGLAVITTHVNWKKELTDMRRFFKSLLVKKHL